MGPARRRCAGAGTPAVYLQPPGARGVPVMVAGGRAPRGTPLFRDRNAVPGHPCIGSSP